MQLELKFGRNLSIREINGLNVMLREIYNKKSDSSLLVKQEELKMDSKTRDTCAYKFTCDLSDLMAIKDFLHDDVDDKLVARSMSINTLLCYWIKIFLSREQMKDYVINIIVQVIQIIAREKNILSGIRLEKGL
jgi:hypothetical protein